MGKQYQPTPVGPIPIDWKLCTVDGIRNKHKKSLISGPFGSNISSKYFVEVGIPVIRGNNLSLDLTQKFVDDNFAYITQQKADELGAWAVKDDLVFTAVGTIGQVGLLTGKEKYEKYIISNKQLRLTVNKDVVTPLFAYYWFASDQMQVHIIQRNTGSSVPLINLGILKSLPIPIPSIEEQQAIAAVLSSLDDKIDLLHRQNKTLEALAQALFRQWFVEEVDASFKEVPLKDLCLKIESGGTPKREMTEFWGGDIPWLTSGEVRESFVLSTKESITFSGLSSSTAKLWDKGTVVVAMYGATAGVVCYTMIQLSANQACCGLKPRPEYEAFVYFYLSRNSANMAEQATGSAQQNLNKGMIENHGLLVAHADKMQQFQLVAGKNLSMMGENVKQIRTLTKLRDTLLPKLMSGEVRVEM